MMQIQSTVISEDFLDEYLERVMKEIIKTMKNVFGPKGTDVFISTARDNNLYFTRDGKEVFSSIKFNDPFAEQLKNLVAQAVYNQADLIGDGTTSVSLIVPITALLIKDLLKNKKDISIFDIKKELVEKLNKVRAELMERSLPIKYKDELHESLVYTTTGDERFYEEITNNIENITDKTLIEVLLNENSSDIVYQLSKDPKIETTILYNDKLIDRSHGLATLNRCAVFFVDGALAINNWQTIALMQLMRYIGVDNVIILCASMDKSTSDAIRRVKTKFYPLINEAVKKELANLTILKLPKYMGYKKDELIDISTLVYNNSKDIGIGSALDFEPKIFQFLYEELSGNDSVEEGFLKLLDVDILKEYDYEESIKNIYKETLYRGTIVELGDNEIRIHNPASDVVKNRVDEIRKEMATNTSVIQKNYYLNRLDKFEADRLTVRIGSDIIANAQKKTELMLDALKASRIAFEKGAIIKGSLYNIYDILNEMVSPSSQEEFNNSLTREILSKISIMVFEAMLDNIYTDNKENFGKIYYQGEYKDEGFKYAIVEPVDCAIKLIDALQLGIDIGMSRAFTVKGFVGSYI